jgi:toluene monooxygenase system ferredoxin subunit
MFVRALATTDLVEGGSVVTAIERKRYLVLWPKGTEPKAYRALCPHQEAPITESPFDGRVLVCEHHGWRFDGETGACVSGQRCQLKALPLRIEGDDVLIDVPVKASRAAPASPA